MAKTKKKTTQPRRKNRAPGSKPCPTKGLDHAALQYAKLLADPCNGPLVSGPFGDGAGGYINRFEADYIINNGATDIGSFLAFVPSNSLVYSSAGVAITSDTVGYTPVLGTAPANTFLAGNADQFRCLAACVQLFWPGSELTRAGITSVGQLAAASFLGGGTTVSTTQLRTNCQHVQRMPEDHVEIIWRPNDYDLTWNNTDSLDGIGKRTALVVSAAGLPVNTGIRVRMTAVYEWLPVLQENMVTPFRSANPSSNTLTDVINYIDETGTKWYHNASSGMRALSNLYAGVSATKKFLSGATKMAMLAL